MLQNDGQVLRFQGLWNDGLDKRQLILMYFLADDTIQINEKHSESGGRYKAPIFLKRTKIPKERDLLVALPGTFNEKTILNVVTTPGSGRRKKNHLISDNRDLSARVVQYYDASDLSVGASLSICGKEILLYDCDNFTREYYKVKYDQDQMKAIEVERSVAVTPVRPVPPYTGIGTEEDSLTSWLGGNSLEPKPPTRDFFKFHKLDRFGYDSHVLRFSARLIVKGEIDKYRKFVISYFLADDQIQVSPGVELTTTVTQCLHILDQCSARARLRGEAGQVHREGEDEEAAEGSTRGPLSALVLLRCRGHLRRSNAGDTESRLPGHRC